MSSHDDNIPLTDSSHYARTNTPTTTGQPSKNAIKQQRGEFATSGIQPSFALELDISTIQHVSLSNIGKERTKQANTPFFS